MNVHYQSSHYVQCDRCNKNITWTSPDFLDAVATGIEHTTDRPSAWYSVTCERGEDGSLTATWKPHTCRQGVLARMLRG